MQSKFTLLFAVMLFAQLTLPAQEWDEYSISEMETYQAGLKTQIFGDLCNVRNAPNAQGSIVAKLAIGTPVTILESSEESSTYNGWTARWSKIQFQQDGKTMSGYIWNGLLSPLAHQTNGVSFVYNVVKAETKKNEYGYDNSTHTVEVRAVRNGKVQSKAQFELQITPGSSTEMQLVDNPGLAPYQNAFRISIYFPACGYANYTLTCLWDGNQLTALPILSGASDAGVFWEDEVFIFPNEKNGIPGKLVYQYELSQGMEEEGELDYKKSMRLVEMKDGRFIKPKLDEL
ncbi:MAG: SH3 domain-containing protein [Saprospiraceae bacterium]